MCGFEGVQNIVQIFVRSVNVCRFSTVDVRRETKTVRRK